MVINALISEKIGCLQGKGLPNTIFWVGFTTKSIFEKK